MGCCMSLDKESIYEVTLDADGVAHRVPKGQGTHYVHISANKETRLEEKTDQLSTGEMSNNTKWPSLSVPVPYGSKRVHPVAPTKEEEPEVKEKAVST